MSGAGYEESLARNLYFDDRLALNAAKLLPGEYYATAQDMVLVTVLGSCVAACIRDSKLGIGGMNHFMLPDAQTDCGSVVGTGARYGTYAMEVLINHVIKLGGQRQRLEAKVFGGAQVLQGLTLTDVGRRNAEFVRRFLAREGIPVRAEDLLDVFPRKVYFFPHSGRAMVKRLQSLHNDTLIRREVAYRTRIKAVPVAGEVELFA